LRLLGETLRYDTRNDRNATIIIFDDMKAASMSKDAANLEGEDGEFYDRHIIGNYIRNVNNGLHQLSIMLDGITR